MAWHTQHLSRRSLFTNTRMLSSMAAQGLHNQLQKPCLLSLQVSSRFAKMIVCPEDQWRNAPPARYGSVHKVTHEKLTSGSNAVLASTQILPSRPSCRAAASAHGPLPNSPTTDVRLRQTALANVGTSFLPLTKHTCAYV